MAEEINTRMKIDHIFESILPTHLRSSETVLPRNFDCLKSLMDTYESACGKLGDYGLKYVKYFVQTCESLPDAYNMSHIAKKVLDACDH